MGNDAPLCSLCSKSIFAADLEGKIGEEIEELFLVKKLTVPRNEAADWLSAILMDRTGEVSALLWREAVEKIGLTAEDKVIRARAYVSLSCDKPRLQVKDFSVLSDGQFVPSDFTPGLSEDELRPLTDELLSMAASIRNEPLKLLLETTFTSPGFKGRFALLPGGHKHHRYNGGLLIHTLEVARVTRDLCIQDEQHRKFHVNSVDPVDDELALTGALLHDIGKVKEFEPFPFNRRKESYYFTGYQTEGAIIVSKALTVCAGKHPEFLAAYKKLRQPLLNILLSGHAGNASLVPPRTKEAKFVQIADKASAERDAFDSAVSGAASGDFVYSDYLQTLVQA